MATKTVVGRLGGAPEVRVAGSAHVVSFSVAETERRFNRESNAWEDGQTLWHDVEAWKNVESIGRLSKGQLVIVEGKEKDASYTPQGSDKKVRRVVINASSVGVLVTDRTAAVQAPAAADEPWGGSSQTPAWNVPPSADEPF